jgi:hypothetical protein
MLERALPMWTDLGDRQNIAYCLHNLGLVDLADAEMAASHRHQEESIRILEEVGDRRGIAFVMESFAMLAAATQAHARAVSLAAAAATLRRELASAPPPAWRDEYDHALQGSLHSLEDDARILAWSNGEGMHMREAIDYACRAGPPANGGAPG